MIDWLERAALEAKEKPVLSSLPDTPPRELLVFRHRAHGRDWPVRVEALGGRDWFAAHDLGAILARKHENPRRLPSGIPGDCCRLAATPDGGASEPWLDEAGLAYYLGARADRWGRLRNWLWREVVPALRARKNGAK